MKEKTKLSTWAEHAGNIALATAGMLVQALDGQPHNFTWNLFGKAFFSSLSMWLFNKGK